ADPEARTRMFRFCHEIVGDGGLLWSGRLVAIEASLRSDGTKGFPLSGAKYLAPKYGYAPGLVPTARRCMHATIAKLGEALESARSAGTPYYSGGALTALDIYSAAAVNLFVPPPDARCPMLRPFRATFEAMSAELGVDVPAALTAHRDLVYERHLE